MGSLELKRGLARTGEEFEYIQVFWSCNATKNTTRKNALESRVGGIGSGEMAKTKTINNINNSINLLGISDLDWGGDLDSRKSTTGNIFILNNSKSNYNNNIAIS